ALDAELSVNGVGLGKAIIDVRAQRVQWHPALMVGLHAGQFRAAKPAGAANLDPFRSEIHRALNGLLHGAPKGHAPLELKSDVFGNELGFDFRLLDLHDVHVNLLAGHFGQFFLELVDLGAFAADDDPRPGSQDGDAAAAGGPLDENPRHAGRFELLFERVANLAVLREQFSELLLVGIPLRAPVLVDPDAQTHWIGLLAHRLINLAWLGSPTKRFVCCNRV